MWFDFILKQIWGSRALEVPKLGKQLYFCPITVSLARGTGSSGLLRKEDDIYHLPLGPVTTCQVVTGPRRTVTVSPGALTLLISACVWRRELPTSWGL